MKGSVFFQTHLHTYSIYIHPTLRRERSSKWFEKWEYLLLCVIRIIDMSPPSLGRVQLKWKWLVICMITGCPERVHTHTHTHHEYVMKAALKLELKSFISFHPLLPHFSHFKSSSPILPPCPSPTIGLWAPSSQMFNISEWSTSIFFHWESVKLKCKRKKQLFSEVIVCKTFLRLAAWVVVWGEMERFLTTAGLKDVRRWTN